MSDIEMVPVKSSLVKGVGYDLFREEMTVRFRNEAEYVYRDVALPVFEALVGAKSVGTFFLNHIKGKYEVTRR